MNKKLVLILLIICMVGFVSAGDYKFQNKSGTDLAIIYGNTGNLTVLGNISSDSGYCIGNDCIGNWDDVNQSGGSGEANDGSNIGTDGIGVFGGKSSTTLQFRNIATTLSKYLSISLDSNDNDIDLDFNETELNRTIDARDNFEADTNCSQDGSCSNVLYTSDEYIGGLSCSDEEVAIYNTTSGNWECGNIDAEDTNTEKSGGGIYLYNDSNYIYLNETELNSTIDDRSASSETDTLQSVTERGSTTNQSVFIGDENTNINLSTFTLNYSAFSPGSMLDIPTLNPYSNDVGSFGGTDSVINLGEIATLISDVSSEDDPTIMFFHTNNSESENYLIDTNVLGYDYSNSRFYFSDDVKVEGEMTGDALDIAGEAKADYFNAIYNISSPAFYGDFFGVFNWTTGDNYNSFDGSTLDFNETLLNNTIDTRAITENIFDQSLNTTDDVVFNSLNVSEGMEITGEVNFDEGWQNGGVSVIDGEVFAQALYTYNITSLGVNNLDINGSLLPIDWDNTFDVGNETWQWRNGYFGSNVFVEGEGVKKWLYNQTEPAINYVDNQGFITGNIFDQSLNTTDDVNFSTVNTGQGANELYGMNQDVKTSSSVTFQDISFPTGVASGVNKLDVTDSDQDMTLYSTKNINMVMDESNSGTGLFSVKKDSAETDSLFTVTNGGKVGIGTDSPNEKLEIQTGANDGLTLSDESTGETYAKLYSNDNNRGYLELSQNGETKIKLTSGSGTSSYFNGGNVGIGTDSPSTKLEIVDTSDGLLTYPLRLKNYATGYDTATGIVFTATTADYGKGGIAFARTGTYGRGDLYFLNDGTADDNEVSIDDTRMVIKSDGKVGIGTDSPQAKLDVSGGDIFVDRGDDKGVWNHLDGSKRAGIVFGPSDGFNELAFYTGSASESMRIDDSGNVGIGTDSPQQDLHVDGDTNVTGTQHMGDGQIYWDDSNERLVIKVGE